MSRRSLGETIWGASQDLWSHFVEGCLSCCRWRLKVTMSVHAREWIGDAVLVMHNFSAWNWVHVYHLTVSELKIRVIICSGTLNKWHFSLFRTLFLWRIQQQQYKAVALFRICDFFPGPELLSHWNKYFTIKNTWSHLVHLKKGYFSKNSMQTWNQNHKQMFANMAIDNLSVSCLIFVNNHL